MRINVACTERIGRTPGLRYREVVVAASLNQDFSRVGTMLSAHVAPPAKVLRSARMCIAGLAPLSVVF
jgi:hypothetical protein